MSKDSQIDPKEVRKAKAKGSSSLAQSGPDGESRSAKTQSGSRQKPGDDKKSTWCQVDVVWKGIYLHNG